MKPYIVPSLLLTFCCIAFFAILYPLLIWGVGQAVAPESGKGQRVLVNGKVLGYQRIGQPFSDDRYFWSRPSAVGYNAAGAGGSNKGPSNPDYLITVKARFDTFMAHHPYLAPSEVPAEMITASGSGLDPHISPQAAAVQVHRVAEKNGIPPAQLNLLVEQYTQKPLWGVLGPSVVDVLSLNLALSSLNK